METASRFTYDTLYMPTSQSPEPRVNRSNTWTPRYSTSSTLFSQELIPRVMASSNDRRHLGQSISPIGTPDQCEELPFNYMHHPQEQSYIDQSHNWSHAPSYGVDHQLHLSMQAAQLQPLYPQSHNFGDYESWPDRMAVDTSRDNIPGPSNYKESQYHTEPTINTYGAYQVSYHGTSTQVSPGTSSELVLASPYAGSSRIPTPTTPASSNLAFQGSNLQLTLGTAQTDNNGRRLYTHREQLQMFREVPSLTIADNFGPFMPQQMYKPHTNSDRKRYVEEVELEAPIYFYSEHPSECGILLSDAMHSRVKRLQGRDETVFEGRGPSVSIRLEWPGYRQWSRQIPTKDFRSPPGPITRAKLAKNVAKCIQRFMDERKNQTLEEDADVRWKISNNHIKLDDLVLVSLHHVSLGSWQPQLRLRRSARP